MRVDLDQTQLRYFGEQQAALRFPSLTGHRTKITAIVTVAFATFSQGPKCVEARWPRSSDHKAGKHRQGE